MNRRPTNSTTEELLEDEEVDEPPVPEVIADEFAEESAAIVPGDGAIDRLEDNGYAMCPPPALRMERR
jgi:hypothetical protein